MFVAVLVIANDFTALSVALPAIEIAFASDVTTVQWVITGYTLVLIIARGLMGVGGALMWPAVLGMTYSMIPPGREALGGSLVMTACGVGNSIGPLLGGALTDTAGWHWIFFLNLPVTLLAMIITYQVVEKDKTDSARERVDYAGVITLSTGLLALLYVLDIGTDLGWLDGKVIGIFILSAVALLLFAIIEHRAVDGALVPRDVFTNTTFMAASIATLLISAIFFASLLYLPQFMSKELGFSAVKSGAGLLPMMGVFAVTSFVSGLLDVVLAICGLLVVIFFVGGRLEKGQWHRLVHRHRAHG